MSTGEGPVRNTRSCAARRKQTHAQQGTPPRDEAQNPEPTEAPAQLDSPPAREESILTSIVKPSSVESEERPSSEENTLSDHGTIRDIPEESYEPEQSYTTAPSLSVNPE